MRVIFSKQVPLQFYVFPALVAAMLLLLSYRIGNYISKAQQYTTYTNHTHVTIAPSICQISADETVVKCGTSTTLNVDNGITNPTWSTGATSSSITVTTSGQYWWQYVDTSRNTVTNGDFSNGNTGFTSQYNYIAPNGSTGSFGALSAEGYYSISTNPRNTHTNFSSFGDHTSGTGKMMIINGSSQNNVTVWTQNITVEPNTSYIFSIWGASAHSSNPAKLAFSINGTLLGTIQFSSTPGNWQNFTIEWTSNSSTVASIGIVNQNTVTNGNDFTLDDILFAPVCRKYFNVSLYPNPPKPDITSS
jgi:hypothetical protein